MDTFKDFSNYYIGNRENWTTQVGHFKAVKLYNLYDGVDLEFFYFNGILKYNFILANYSNIDQVTIQYKGQDNIKVKNNEVIVGTTLGDIIEQAPISYTNQGRLLPTSYLLSNNMLQFKFNDKPTYFERRQSITLDPGLVFSTYSGSIADNFGYTATYDQFGNGYAGGSVFTFGFPTTAGAFQEVFKGGKIDIGISKYNSAGTQRIYATYIGGNGDDHPHSMIVNSKNELIVMGSSSSTNFPTTASAYDIVHNNGGLNANFDIVLFKLDELGTDLVASTYLGGSNDDGLNGNSSTGAPSGALINNYADNFRGEVIIDSNDNIFVASSTKSVDFPYKNGSSPNLIGTQNAVIFRMTPNLDSLKWSTFWGSGECSGYGLALGLNNDLFVVGGITGQGILTGSSFYQPNNQGGRFDGYIVKLNKNTGIGNSSFLGTSGDDQAYLVQTDSKGLPYVFGQTTGNWPETGSTYQNSGSGQFIIRMKTDLSGYDKSMVFGSGTKPANISPTAFLVDQCDRIFISGWGGKTNEPFPGANFNGGFTNGMATTPDALQKNTDGSDFYLAVFSKNLEELLYGTYFGGTTAFNEEHVDGGTSRFDKKGVIYQSVCASCNSSNSGFPTTFDAWSRTNKGLRPGSTNPGCNNALFKIDFESFNRQPIVRDTFFTIVATTNLSFTFQATDPDKYDSLFMDMQHDLFGNNSPSINISNDLARSSLFFNWTPNCSNVSSDTYTIKVSVRDQGCPTTDSNFALIKILVTPPPLAPNPEVVCIKFDDNGLPLISWEAFASSPYSVKNELLRKNPNGSITPLFTFTNIAAGSYKEKVGSDFTTKDYCYFFISENICGQVDTSIVRACTLKEFNDPIVGEKVILVTVEQDTFIKIVWNHSDEDDFGGYRIYRKNNDGSAGKFDAVGYVDLKYDTTFIDRTVKVDDYSYCYYVIVEDDCGNKSLPQDTSCSILLKGMEHPFFFTLSSNPYVIWETGVKDYDLWSSVDTGTLRFKKIIPNQVDFVSARDGDLDYDWGGYYYQYRANNQTNDTTPTRVSKSNTIYLIQPPQLHVPSAFSPNGDTHNDEWGIVDVFVKTYQILVFNRWGEKVYDSEDKHAQWNAVYKNTNPSDNVFIWIAYYTGWDERKYTQKGNVTVVK